MKRELDKFYDQTLPRLFRRKFFEKLDLTKAPTAEDFQLNHIPGMFLPDDVRKKVDLINKILKKANECFPSRKNRYRGEKAARCATGVSLLFEEAYNAMSPWFKIGLYEKLRKEH